MGGLFCTILLPRQPLTQCGDDDDRLREGFAGALSELARQLVGFWVPDAEDHTIHLECLAPLFSTSDLVVH
jgi:hypothetical protein